MTNGRNSRQQSRHVQIATRWLKNNLMEWISFLGLVIGLVAGMLARVRESSQTAVLLVSLPGDVLQNLLKMLVLPFIISSIITASSKLNLKAVAILGWKLVLFYLVSNLAAVIFGLIAVSIIQPGSHKKRLENVPLSADGLDTFLDFFKNMFPENLVQATFQQVKTVHVPKNESILQGMLQLEEKADIEFSRDLVYKTGTNFLGLIVFGTAFGLVANHMGPTSKILVDFFLILYKIMYRLLRIALWYFPLGVIFLLTGNIMATQDMHPEYVTELHYYVLTVLVGICFHVYLFLPLVYFIAIRKNPLHLFKNIFYAKVIGFGTGCSTSTLPASIFCLEEKCEVEERVSRFVLPVGSVLNLNGTAIYKTIAVIFVAQLQGTPLGFGEYLQVGLICSITSFVAHSIPNGSCIGMLLALQTVGVKSSHLLSLLVVVDWMLSRVCTVANVTGDLVAANVVYKWSKEALDNTAPLDLHDVTRYIDEDEDYEMKNGKPERRV